jgi:hypothetical protein
MQNLMPKFLAPSDRPKADAYNETGDAAAATTNREISADFLNS